MNDAKQLFLRSREGVLHSMKMLQSHDRERSSFAIVRVGWKGCFWNVITKVHVSRKFHTFFCMLIRVNNFLVHYQILLLLKVAGACLWASMYVCFPVYWEIRAWRVNWGPALFVAAYCDSLYFFRWEKECFLLDPITNALNWTVKHVRDYCYHVHHFCCARHELQGFFEKSMESIFWILECFDSTCGWGHVEPSTSLTWYSSSELPAALVYELSSFSFYFSMTCLLCHFQWLHTRGIVGQAFFGSFRPEFNSCGCHLFVRTHTSLTRSCSV